MCVWMDVKTAAGLVDVGFACGPVLQKKAFLHRAMVKENGSEAGTIEKKSIYREPEKQKYIFDFTNDLILSVTSY